MNILILTPDIPYPTASGAAIRNYGIIRGLIGAGHTITLLTFIHSSVDEASNPLYQICEQVITINAPNRSKQERILNLLSTTKADIQLRLVSDEFEQQLIELLNENSFDLVQFEGIELGTYLSTIKAHHPNAKIVYDAHNAEAELQRVIYQIDRKTPKRLPLAIYSYIQAQRIERFEKYLCQSVDAVITVSGEDKVLLSVHNGAPISVMSNGIFVDEYTPTSDNTRASNQLVFTGKMDYRPNVDAIEWFASSILPHIKQQNSDTELIIVGRNPHPRIQPYADQAHVTITGWVDSVQPYLHSSTVFIVPLRMGSGTRLKILEAMASGCAIVSTSIGAAGINNDVKQAIQIADNEDMFAQTIVSLLRDSETCHQLGHQAMQTVRQYYDWSVLIPKLLTAYKDIGLG